MESYTRTDPFAAETAVPAGPLTDATVPVPAVDTLSGMGEALLDIVRAAALEKGTALPDRQSVYMAPIPADCEQVAVLFSGWNITPAPEGPMICAPYRWMAGYSVIITRCTPAMPPKNSKALVSPEKMIEASRISSDDAEIMLAVVNRLGEIGPDLSIVCNPPQGGMQTVELNVQLLSVGSL